MVAVAGVIVGVAGPETVTEGLVFKSAEGLPNCWVFTVKNAIIGDAGVVTLLYVKEKPPPFDVRNSIVIVQGPVPVEIEVFDMVVPVPGTTVIFPSPELSVGAVQVLGTTMVA